MKSLLEYPESGDEITRVEFVSDIWEALVTIYLQTSDESPVGVKISLKKERKTIDKMMRSAVMDAVEAGIHDTSPHNPGYIWNILLRIEQMIYPKFIQSPKYETRPTKTVEGRIY